MDFPARVTLLSGAVVLLKNSSQMEALPLGAVFQPTFAVNPALPAPLLDGQHDYREIQPSTAGEAIRLRVELQAAAEALQRAAEAIRDSGRLPMKAQHAKLAAERAKAALEETAVA